MKDNDLNFHNSIFELEETALERKALFDKVNSFSEEFLESLPERKAFHYNTHQTTDSDSFFSINNEKNSIENVLDFFKERVLDTGLNPTSGGHLGYIPGGGIFSSAIADYLAAITNRYAGEFYASPGAVRMGDALVNWAGKLMGYTEGFGGNLTSGGSIANLIALHTAKHHKNITGSTITKSVVYCTAQSHHSINKALKIIGLEDCIIRVIALDAQFRISVKALEDQVRVDEQDGFTPFLLIANAGSTDVGAVDPLVSLANIAKTHKMWFHVDGAYGAFFMLTEKGREKLKGIELADSIILDPHKGMFLPYGSGIVLVKNVKHLAAAHSYTANYMRDAYIEGQYSPSNLSPELSKHFRGLRMWLPLKLYGQQVFTDYLNEKLQLTTYLAQKLVEIGYKVICEPELSVVAFRLELKQYSNDEQNKKVLDFIQKDGRIFISSTVLNNKLTLRAAILSFRTHKKDIDLFLELLKEAKLSLEV
ncbi:aminotransferase class V-fold PLP-dependent enzyme [Aequorivita sp. F47161]|uniref:Aminotransferase class V-fold PLP-dependent enzyme n=1 Tax=Aequorivita vitellina TaxID=2874475 RepID=A0A9X1QXL3_9FLAO|nr:aminotransferase class V-fold PLP-dependent enzyme [Aequorivita vitellina]MCG2419664.1 aminotransferase class V-fold PLP-dependent enzyme [Aequorivita vitellina]